MQPDRVRLAPLRSPPGLAASLRAFWALAEKTFRAQMVYRASTLLSVFASAGGYCIFLLVWSEVYRHRGNTMTLPPSQVFPYLVAALVLNFTLTSTLENRAGQRIMKGLITADLSKPMGFLPWHLAQALGDLLGNALLALPMVALGFVSLGHGLAPPDPSAAVLGVVGEELVERTPRTRLKPARAHSRRRAGRGHAARSGRCDRSCSLPSDRSSIATTSGSSVHSKRRRCARWVALP